MSRPVEPGALHHAGVPPAAATEQQPESPGGDLGMLYELRRLTSGGDDDTVTELIELFLESAPQRAAAARRAWDAGDASGVRRAAHALKGTAGSLGFRALMALCAGVERQAESGCLDGLEPRLAEIEAEFDRLRPLLEQERRLGSQGGRG